MFDGFHCCDPSVIEGQFAYKGENYKYLMAYTGNTSDINNKVGLAVSNELMNGWIALDDPIVKYDGDNSHWGVGQPCLLSVDKKGIVMLFYSVGSTSTYVVAEKWDLSNLDSPKRITSAKLTHNGLTDLNGNLDVINNVDVAFDEKTSRYYVVSEGHPNPVDADPTFVGTHFRVTYLTEKNTIGDLFESVNSQAGRTWMNLAKVGEAETGFPRNHNCGIVKDSFGRLINSQKIEILYSMSNVGNNYHWTYRIYSTTIDILE